MSPSRPTGSRLMTAYLANSRVVKWRFAAVGFAATDITSLSERNADAFRRVRV
jgi:hypothetical protein